MKIIRNVLICFSMVAAFLLHTNTAFATELAGDEVVECKVSIFVADATNNYGGEKINLFFKDITGTAEKQVELTKENSWGSGGVVSFTLPAPTTYNVIITEVTDGFKLVDSTTKQAVTSFAAGEGAMEFHWSIIKESEESKVATDADHESVNNEEANAVYQEFLDAVSFIENDPSWYDGVSALLNQYGEKSINRDIFSKWYEAYVKGGTKEEYFSMSSFEQFLWTESYTRLAYAVGGSNDFDKYYGSEAAFQNSIIRIVTNLMNGENSDTVKEAYEKLMMWQYGYVKEHGVPYNFITDRSYIEEIAKTPAQEDDSADIEKDNAVESETDKENKKESVTDEEEKGGIWSDTLNLFAENAVSIILILILGAVLTVFIYKRKQKNKDSF